MTRLDCTKVGRRRPRQAEHTQGMIMFNHNRHNGFHDRHKEKIVSIVHPIVSIVVKQKEAMPLRLCASARENPKRTPTPNSELLTPNY